MSRESREIRLAIEEEVAQWPGVALDFESSTGGGHPKAVLSFEGRTLRRAYSGNSGTRQAMLVTLRDMREICTQLGAKRKEEPTAAKDEEAAERAYHKPNDGRAKRPSPVEGEPAAPKASLADQLAAHPAARPAAEGSKIEQIEAAVEAIVDGIYFGLPSEVYHAIPRLSGSGLQKLAVSPATFWRGSWLDPNRPELDEDATKAQILGKAYHTARLEPHLFEGLYCREPDKSDFPAEGLLTSDTAVKAALKDLGLTQTIGTESIVERAERLEEAGYKGTIWPLEYARWKDQLNGRTPIAAKYWDDLTTDMERLRGNPDIAEKLSGGAAEVSIFYTDRYNIPMKARIDFLRPDLWDELKTFDNSRGKALRQALADALRYNRYHIQAVAQRDAIEAVRLGGLKIIGAASDAERELIASIQMRPGELACWFIFQEKNGVPNLLARQFHFFHVPMNTKLGHAGASEEAIARVEEAARTKTGIHIRAIGDIDRGKRDFALYSQVYRPGEPWAPVNPTGDFEDDDFNRNWLEGHYE